MNYLGLTREDTAPVAEQLNLMLADYHVYYQNLRNCHWNVTGTQFFELHKLFEALYVDALTKIDEIAERVLTLRHRPISNMSRYLEDSNVDEAGRLHNDHDMVTTILENHKILIQRMRDVLEAAGHVKDDGTIDLISGFLQNLEKHSWMLDAWLSKQQDPVLAMS